jgi:hypothetical protein
MKQAITNNVPHHIHIPNDHGFTTPRIPTHGASNKQAQISLSSAQHSLRHTNTEKRKQGNRINKTGWSLKGKDKWKISPVILISAATVKFATYKYNIRWNMRTGNDLRVTGREDPTTYIL